MQSTASLPGVALGGLILPKRHTFSDSGSHTNTKFWLQFPLLSAMGHVVKKSQIRPLKYITISAPPSLECPYRRSTKTMGTCARCVSFSAQSRGYITRFACFSLHLCAALTLLCKMRTARGTWPAGRSTSHCYWSVGRCEPWRHGYGI